MTEKHEIDRIVEAISEMIVMVEPNDLPLLSELNAKFNDLARAAAESSLDQVARVSQAARDLIKKIIDGEDDNIEATLHEISQTISLLQTIIRDDRKVDEISFPEKLGLLNEQAGHIPPSLTVILPENVDKDLFAEFLVGQKSVMEEMERQILALEKRPDNETLATLKRIIHNLKGEAGVLGLFDPAKICHELEGYIDLKEAESSPDILFMVKDWFEQIFNAYEGKGPPPISADQILTRLTSSKNDGNTQSSSSSGENQKKREPESREEVTEVKEENNDKTVSDPVVCGGEPDLLNDFIVEAREHLESADLQLLTLETEPENEEALNAVFRSFHTIKGVAGFLELKELGLLAHEAESLLDRARKGEIIFSGKVVDVTFAAVDRIKQYIDDLERMLNNGTPVSPDELLPELLSKIQNAAGEEEIIVSDPLPSEGKKLGEILVEEGTATQDDIEDALQEQKDREPPPPKLGELLVEKKQSSARDIAGALRKQKQGGVKVKETVKVDTDRLDRMIDTIGELVIAESIVSNDREIAGIASEQVTRNLRQLNKITRELQEIGMSMRMVPLRSTFHKMARLARDLAKKAGKNINFNMVGEDIELDKGVVEKIGDPLIHMIRNAADHGIESSSEKRKEAGKPETGQIELRAFHKGGSIHIEVEDDGKGLDRKAIIAKAQGSGIIQDGNSMTDQEAFNLIFRPGFSTAEKVTDVSGRGVGMDVVRRNIESLRGRVEIDSIHGKGSVFHIQLPLTLAIIDGMVVRVGKEKYIIPTLSVVETVRPVRADLSTVINKGEMFSMRGQLIPLFRISRLFSLRGAEDDPTRALVVVVEDGGRKTGLLVDNLLGQQQTVIKNLGPEFEKIGGISGGAIMPDGRVGLILDIAGIVRMTSGHGERSVVDG